MKDEEGNAAIKKIVELKSNKAFMFIDDSSEHKNAKCAKKNIVPITSHFEQKDILLNNNIFEAFDE